VFVKMPQDELQNGKNIFTEKMIICTTPPTIYDSRKIVALNHVHSDDISSKTTLL